MSNEKKKIRKASILICGSSDLTDKNFVFTMLSVMNTGLKDAGSQIGTIYTSKFSGACQFAKVWVRRHNEACKSKDEMIEIKEHIFDLHLEERKHSFYEEAEIPLPVLRNDPFYKKGQAQLAATNLDMVMAFPNNLGKIGPSTANIKRFALLAGINYLNCADAYKILQQKVAKISKEENELDNTNYQESSNQAPVIVNRRALTR